MEPVRGGKLAKLPDAMEEKLRALRPEESIPAWCFRFLQELPNVKMVLSGMSDEAQMHDNVATFAERNPLSEEETALLFEIAEGMKDSVPCTGCRYCCDGCPMGLDIPGFLHTYNELRTAPSMNAGMRIEFMPEEERPSACIGCGACTAICPQNIDIPGALADLSVRLAKRTSWTEICRQREEASKRK